MTHTNNLMVRVRRILVCLVAVLTAQPDAIAQTVEYLHPDSLGTPVAATSESGATLWTRKYTAYGAEAGTTGTPTPAPGFTGGVTDPDQGLVLLHNRYYDPQIGRFISVDPVGYMDGDVQSFNRYAYAANNPFRFRDENGAWAEDAVIATASIAVGAYSFSKNLQQKNYWWAAVDLLGIIHDAVAYAIPAYPGAAGLAIQATRRMPAAGIAIQAGKKGTVEIIEITAREAAPAATELGAALARVCCFAGGTPVVTESGLKPIEEIAVGDRVLSKSDVTGEVEFKAVVRLLPGHDREIWEVELAVDDASDVANEFIETTDDHPWRAVDGTWVHTQFLEPGMLLQRADGDSAEVVAVRKTDRIEATFNFEVADFHTYFVGTGQFWVHNANCWDGVSALTEGMKGLLRTDARAVWAARMGKAAGEMGLQVHHRIPLEWAHLFPKADPNALKNLVGVTEGIHAQMSAGWAAWKKSLNGRTPTADEVMGVVKAMDEAFRDAMKTIR
jgi:RHS repeat-associated protein